VTSVSTVPERSTYLLFVQAPSTKPSIGANDRTPNTAPAIHNTVSSVQLSWTTEADSSFLRCGKMTEISGPTAECWRFEIVVTVLSSDMRNAGAICIDERTK